VPFEAYGIHDAIGEINRPQFVNLMAGWLASIPEVDARLRARPPARVADVACGTAWSSIAIARAYPEVTVDALDVDSESIETAHRNVAASGLADRVKLPSTTRATRSSAAATTWSRSSRPCTT
jgi:methylase of polypeptide subunit release factors